MNEEENYKGLNNVIAQKALREYVNLDMDNSEEVVAWIKNMYLIRNEISPFINRAISYDLKAKGYLTAREYEKQNKYLEKYNTLEQFFNLDDDKEDLKNCLIGRYISSVDNFGKPSPLVLYLSIIFCERFRDYKNTDKIVLLKQRETFKQMLKRN